VNKAQSNISADDTIVELQRHFVTRERFVEAKGGSQTIAEDEVVVRFGIFIERPAFQCSRVREKVTRGGDPVCTERGAGMQVLDFCRVRVVLWDSGVSGCRLCEVTRNVQFKRPLKLWISCRGQCHQVATSFPQPASC
jgi:hypothetical protein